jgi:nucleoside-diphosphate-sugar epimerase
MQALHARGEEVLVANRSGQMPATPPGVRVAAVDAYDPAAVRALAQDAAVVYQCAQPPYQQWAEKFPALQAAILSGLSGTGARLVIGENVYMYGRPPEDGRLTEDLPYTAHTRKGRARAAMAEAALAAHRRGDLWVTLARGSDFYGPWVTGSILGERVFRPALAGKKAEFIGRTDLPHTFTYIGDFGRAMALLGSRDEAGGQAWHVPNDCPTVTQAEVARLIFAELGLPARFSGMGRAMLAIGGLFIPAARETMEMMYEFEQPFIVDSSRFESSFDLRPTPLAEGIRSTIEWYRQSPPA